MKKWILLAALLSSFAFVSCAGSGQSVNTPAQVAGDAQNDTAIPNDDAFMQSAQAFSPEQISLPSAETYLDDALKDDPEAQFILSMMYRGGIGGVEHIKDGRMSDQKVDLNREMNRWYARALTNDSDYALYLEKYTLAKAPDDALEGAREKSLSWLENAARTGFSDAEFVLGLIYYHGLGVEKDEAKGQTLIARAALHGLPVAMYQVAMFYELGIGTSVNKTKAMTWLEKAEKAGNVDATFILALKYLDGIDVEKNAEKAAYYYKKHDNDDGNYHAYNLFLREGKRGNFREICTSTYDLFHLKDFEAGDCDGEGLGWDEELSEDENMRLMQEYYALRRTQYSQPYRVDYGIAMKWLEQVTANDANLHARILKAQACEGELTCQCNDGIASKSDLDALYQQNSSNPLVQFMLASFYQYRKYRFGNDSESGNHDIASKVQFVKGLYEAADKAGIVLASNELAELYYYGSDNSEFFRNGDLVKEDRMKALEYYKHAKNIIEVRYASMMLGHAARDKGEIDKAIALYETAIANGSSDGALTLGTMYHQGKLVPKDDDKAITYLKKAIELGDYKSSITEPALVLAEIYQSRKNAADAIKYCKMAIETNPFYTKKQEYALCKAMISKLPKIDSMEDALMHEIDIEKGKKASAFFVTKSAVKPCQALMREYPGYDNATPYCDEIVAPLYEESIAKAMRGITALVMAEKGKMDLDIIENTYYYLAVMIGMNQDLANELETVNPNVKAMSRLYNIGDDVRRKVYYIWFLRQIPYAAKAVFSHGTYGKSWDDYLNDADKAIAQEVKLRSAFGIDLLKYPN